MTCTAESRRSLPIESDWLHPSFLPNRNRSEALARFHSPAKYSLASRRDGLNLEHALQPTPEAFVIQSAGFRFGINLLAEYGTEEIPETKKPVVNPVWRQLDRQSRSLRSRLIHRQAAFSALTLHPESDPKQVEKF